MATQKETCNFLSGSRATFGYTKYENITGGNDESKTNRRIVDEDTAISIIEFNSNWTQLGVAWT